MAALLKLTVAISQPRSHCEKKAHLAGPQTIDNKPGPAAVLRNLSKVISEGRQAFHLVFMDRFYSSVALAVEPKHVKDCQRDTGGVDVFDQLRLQRYSLQIAFTFKTYYKT
jgi:hypothetical protein